MEYTPRSIAQAYITPWSIAQAYITPWSNLLHGVTPWSNVGLDYTVMEGYIYIYIYGGYITPTWSKLLHVGV